MFTRPTGIGSLALQMKLYLWLDHELGESKVLESLAEGFASVKNRTSLAASRARRHSGPHVDCPALFALQKRTKHFNFLATCSSSHLRSPISSDCPFNADLGDWDMLGTYLVDERSACWCFGSHETLLPRRSASPGLVFHSSRERVG